MSLKTGRITYRIKWEKLPITSDVIRRVEDICMNDNKHPIMLFTLHDDESMDYPDNDYV